MRVLLRVSCFHDPWMTQHRPELALKGVPGWLDPGAPGAQDYLLAVVDETLAAGVDGIQLDYVRFPTHGTAGAPFRHDGTVTSDVIAGFVKRAHEHTQAAGVALSIDVFGVVAWQHPVEVRATGQDLTKLGGFVEAVSPMVYPSHFERASMGTPSRATSRQSWGSAPGRRCRSCARRAPPPWSARGSRPSRFARRATARATSPQIEQAQAAGGSGWLAWNAGGYYNEVFVAASVQHPARLAER